MDILDNSPQRWNRFWANGVTNFYLNLPASRSIEHFVRRQLHYKAIGKLLGSISLFQKDIIELGSGTGSNSIHLARFYKAKSITLVDFSEKALTRVREESCSCRVVKVKKNILKFSPQKNYDFVHSTGLIEHFFDKERSLVMKKHAQCVRPGGLVMVWVPIFSSAFTIIQKINRCLGIKEIPFTKDELQILCRENNLDIVRDGETVFGALYGILARKKD